LDFLPFVYYVLLGVLKMVAYFTPVRFVRDPIENRLGVQALHSHHGRGGYWFWTFRVDMRLASRHGYRLRTLGIVQ